MDARARLAARTIGQYPVSIATSLALESLAGIHPDIPAPDVMPIVQYQALWVNLRTLFRNLYGSVDAETQLALHAHHLAEGLIEEMGLLETIVRDMNPNIKVMFYVNNLPDLIRRYPHASLRHDLTDKQKEFTGMMVRSLERTIQVTLKTSHNPPLVFQGDLQAKQLVRTCLMTNYAWDLTSTQQLGETDLLESHTGRIKPASQWYTKYYNGKHYPMIPFRRGFLPVFGDDTLFRPMPKPARDSIIQLAEQYQWTNVTTVDRLRFSLSQLKDKYLGAVVASMLS